MKNELKSQLEPLFEDVKDLIKSTAESTKTVLRKEMAEGFARLEGAIKSVKEDLLDTETRLSGKIDTIGTRLDDHEAKPANIAHKAA